MTSDPIPVFGQLIRMLEREIDYQLKYGSCCDVSLAQCNTLLELGTFESTTVSELTDILKLDKSTLSRTIDCLVQLNLVSREADSNDRRFVRVALTPEGKKSYESISSMCNQLYRRVFEFIPESQREQVMASISILMEAMEKAKVGSHGTGGTESCCK